MITKISVVISLQLEGLHCWPEAKDVFPDVAFLSDLHRHMFHFKLYKKVYHDDRDVEFIRWKREVVSYLNSKYKADNVEYLNFGRMSCEQIGIELANQFDCYRVEVWEDGENGAIIETQNITMYE
jgi:hypothetical protein